MSVSPGAEHRLGRVKGSYAVRNLRAAKAVALDLALAKGGVQCGSRRDRPANGGRKAAPNAPEQPPVREFGGE